MFFQRSFVCMALVSLCIHVAALLLPITTLSEKKQHKKFTELKIRLTERGSLAERRTLPSRASKTIIKATKIAQKKQHIGKKYTRKVASSTVSKKKSISNKPMMEKKVEAERKIAAEQKKSNKEKIIAKTPQGEKKEDEDTIDEKIIKKQTQKKKKLMEVARVPEHIVPILKKYVSHEKHVRAGSTTSKKVKKNKKNIKLSYEKMLPLWINQFWYYPEKAKKQGIIGEGTIFITIDRLGNVLKKKVIETTGYSILDQALLRMVTEANPVLPLPEDYYPHKKTRSYEMRFAFYPGYQKN